jgi:hypothetical protein
MTVLTEGRHAGEFLVSEANGTLSRDTVTVASGQKLEAGTVVELNHANKAIVFATDSDSVAAGVLFNAVDATDADVPGAVIIARLAEVKAEALVVDSGDSDTPGKEAAIASLRLLTIIAR